MVGKENDLFTFVAVGDVSPKRDDPPSIFRYCRDALSSADIVFGQMESPLSDRGTPMFTPGVNRRLPPKNISALTEEGAGFDVMSFAGNHSMDYGWEAFYDTLDALKKNKIAVVGAGRNIAEARTPAILERKGTKVGFLAYLSIINPGLIAQENIPGCVPLMASTCYQQMSPWPGAPPLVVTKLFPENKQALEDDIRELRPQVDVLIVSMHCGIETIPAIIAMYQKEAAYAAIDSGADLVLQHHAHILKGIEVYKGKAIFYGLGNFATEHSAPSSGETTIKWTPALDQYKKLITKIKPIPGWEEYRYHPDARKTIIAKAYIQGKKIQKVTYLPCYLRPSLREYEVVKRKDPRAQEVFDYVKQISDTEDLKVDFSWEGDEVLVSRG